MAGSSTRLTRTGATPTTSYWSAGRCTERREHAIVATKFGFRFPPDATPHLVPTTFSRRQVLVNAEPRYVRQYALASLARLGIERIDLWYPHFPDPEVPIEDTVGAMADVVAEGLVAHIGLSNVTAEQLRRACSVHAVAAVQVEWSLWTPIDAELLAVAREHDVGIVAWSPLGGGFLTGSVIGLAEDDFRTNFDRFSPEHLASNNERYSTTPSGGGATRDHAWPARPRLASSPASRRRAHPRQPPTGAHRREPGGGSDRAVGRRPGGSRRRPRRLLPGGPCAHVARSRSTQRWKWCKDGSFRPNTNSWLAPDISVRVIPKPVA